jgi:surface protein
MAQQNTTVPSKISGDQLDATEFNQVNSVVNSNATDAEFRVGALEVDAADVGARLTTIEGTSIPIQAYASENLPATADKGTIAFDCSIEALVYFKNGSWYKVSDNAEIVLLYDFVFTVNTANTGTSANDQFTLPLFTGNTYNFEVDWGDGNSETVTSDASITHTFTGGAGTYTVTINGVFEGVKFNNGGDKLKITEVSNLLGLTFAADGSDAFYGCSNVDFPVSAAAPDTSATENFMWFFNGCSSLTRIPHFDASSGTNFFGAFRDCSQITEFPSLDLSGIPITSTTALRDACRGMSSLTDFDAVTFGDVGTDLRSTCSGCSSLTHVPSWNTSRVTGLRDTFFDCSSIVDFPAWDTSSVTSFHRSWSGCTSLADFPVLDYSSGTDFTDAWKDCALNSNAVDNILSALVSSGVANEHTSLAGGTTIAEASWSTQAQADAATLRANGWNIASN